MQRIPSKVGQGVNDAPSSFSPRKGRLGKVILRKEQTDLGHLSCTNHVLSISLRQLGD